MIVCHDRNRGIGLNGELIFNDAEDMRNFRETTEGHNVVMGRKTQESLPHGFLPKRHNVVLSRGRAPAEFETSEFTRRMNDKNATLQWFNSPVPIILGATKDWDNEKKHTFIIGGQQIYELFMPHAHRLIITEVDMILDSDAFFPPLEKGKWIVIDERQLTNARVHITTYYRKPHSR